MQGIKRLAGALVIIGALNWGLVAIAEFDLVASLFGMEFGETSALTRIVYGLVGLSAVFLTVAAIGRRNEIAPAGARSAA
jgi:uncharacterized membrane protein YuzA (DUF378 family)